MHGVGHALEMSVVHRPLDRFGSIKLGIAIVVTVGVSSVVSVVGFRLGVPSWLRQIIASAIALALVQVLAQGMTSPLRDMATAARLPLLDSNTAGVRSLNVAVARAADVREARCHGADRAATAGAVP